MICYDVKEKTLSFLDEETCKTQEIPPSKPTLDERVDMLEVTTDDMILLMAELIGG